MQMCQRNRLCISTTDRLWAWLCVLLLVGNIIMPSYLYDGWDLVPEAEAFHAMTSDPDGRSEESFNGLRESTLLRLLCPGL